ncbi:gliding motility-associated C-terminal domain-containing protein, partial [Prolixibacteraceae bacterium JC049]|nr:gliding motility-associated C-terminal domain-containing protein [Prolixibacteraceae bacterium JC049]
GTLTAEAGGGLEVVLNGRTYVYGTDSELSITGNTWRLNVGSSAALSDGVYDVVVRVSDAAGNQSEDSTTNELTIDTIAPIQPTVTPQITSDSAPVINGTITLASGEEFRVSVGGRTYVYGVDPELTITGNNWTLNIPNALSEGIYDVVATVTDAAGNVSRDTTTNELTIDVTPPVTPTVDELTSDSNTPSITGSVSIGANEQFSVTVNGQTYILGTDSELTVTGNTWTLNIGTPLPDGVYDVIASLRDEAGNISNDTTTNELVIDTVAPAIPTVIAVATKDPTPTIQGTVTLGVNEQFSVEVNGRIYVFGTDSELTVSGNNWTLAVAETLAEGTYDVKAVVRDAAGNESVDTTSNELVIDTTAGIPPTVTTLVTTDTTPTIQGTVTLELNDQFRVTVGGRTYVLGTDSELTVNGGTWKLEVPVVLAEGVYDVVAVVRDAAGNESIDQTTNELTIDNTAPVIPTVNSFTTSDTTPTITGTVSLESNGSFSVTVNGVTYRYGEFAGLEVTGNTWSLTIPDANALPLGEFDVIATVTDEAGNSAVDNTTNEVTIINAVIPPTVNSQTTNNQSPQLSGTVNYSAGDIFKVKVNGVTYAYNVDPELSISGNIWTLNVAETLDQGIYDIEAIHTDGLGNVLTDSTTGELTIILDSVDRPTVYGLTTKDTTPTVTGTVSLESGDNFKVTVNGVTYVLGVNSELSVNGINWTLNIPDANALGVGVYDVVAIKTTGAGTELADTSTNELNIVEESRNIDLAITKTGDARVIIGDTVYYDLKVDNLGDVSMNYLLIEDDLTGKGLAMARYRIKGEQSWDNAKSWNGRTVISELAANATKTLQIRAYVIPQNDRTITNVAWVNRATASSEENAANNTSSFNTELYNGVEARIRPESDTICVNGTATMSAGVSKGLNLVYLWNVTSSPNGSNYTLSNPTLTDVTFTADTPGDYSIAVTARNTSTGITNSATATVHVATVRSVIEGFHPVTQALYYPQVNDVEIYGAEKADGTSTWPRLDGTQSLGLGNTYLWTSNDEGTIADGNLTDASVTVGSEGIYQLKVVNRFGCENQNQVTVGKKYHPIGVPRDTTIKEDAVISLNVFPNTIQYPGDSLVYDQDGDYDFNAVNIVNADDNSQTTYGTVTYDEQTRLLKYTQSKPINNQQQQDEIRLVITDQYSLPTEEFAVNITIEPRPFIVPNAFSPNGDGINDNFVIEGITKDEFAVNTIEIYNRWGGKVFTASNYDNVNNVWDGRANVGGTIGTGELPTGTYYFVLRISGEQSDYTGWIYLDR